MRYKLLIGILVLGVSALMLMSNAMASGGPPVWRNQATLSNIDSNPSQDPENSGYGTFQVVVWEEWNGNDWDIWAKFSIANGAPGSWAFLPALPNQVNVDEIHPAVAVTRFHQVGGMAIHVVYQRWSNAGGGQWDICHTYLITPAVVWSAPVVLDAVPNQDARDPAIVYTEDLAFPGPFVGMLTQFVWAELNSVTLSYEILYDAYYYDPIQMPPTGYLSPLLAPPTPPVIRACRWGDCEVPEIASIDDETSGGNYDHYFAVTWQEPSATGQLNVWFVDGKTQTSGGFPPGTFTALTAGSLGQLNPVTPTDNCYDPDIATTQDYQAMNFYFHVNWVRFDTFTGLYYIESCYLAALIQTPLLPFVLAPTAQGPTVSRLDRPTIASKLIPDPNNIVFETWMAWEDSTIPGATNPDIWCIVATYTLSAPPVFAYTWGPGRVGYVPPQGGGSIEYNPELWNRNDITRTMPPLTHLVFDQTIVPAVPEVVYIDP